MTEIASFILLSTVSVNSFDLISKSSAFLRCVISWIMNDRPVIYYLNPAIGILSNSQISWHQSHVCAQFQFRKPIDPEGRSQKVFFPLHFPLPIQKVSLHCGSMM